MIRNTARSVIVHIDNMKALPNKINSFHLEMIERILNQSTLTLEQKLTVIDKIMADMQSREIDGVIK